MNPKRALLIINPISGSGKKKGLDLRVAERLQFAGFHVDTEWTKAAGDATTLARQAAEQGFDTVIAAGGDGTVNETAMALCNTGVNFGIIPCGSGNGLARHLNIPIDVRESLEVIATGRTEVCDNGEVNGHKFFCTFGMGFDAAVGHKFAKSKQRGLATYIRTTLNEYRTYQPEEYIITANGQVLTERAFVVAVCNASQYGNNAYIAPQASISDGLLDVTIIHYGNPLTTAMVGIDLMAGTIENNMLINTFRAESLRIERKSAGAVHLDGEPMELPSVVDINCCKHSLSIYTPGPDVQVRPLLTPIMSLFNEIGTTIRSIVKK